MSLSQADRIAFSLQIVEADTQAASFEKSKAQLQVQIDKLEKLDTANKNLFDPYNTLVNSYQAELTKLDGDVRTTYVEQDIQNSANKTIGNYFYPNNPTVSVPSLSATQNVWTQIKPFAMSYSIGKNYVQVYPSTTTKEPDLISAAQAFITAASAYSDMENTTGQQCGATGTCSNPIYTDEPTCTLNGGVWTPGPDAITSYAAIQTLKTNLVTAINDLKTFLLAEVALVITDDSNTSRQTDNDAAINDINNVIIPAINTWLAYSDFNTSHGQSTCAGFNGYNSNLLAPTKLHSVQLAALQSALTTRSSYVTTRISQITSNLGTIVQNVSTGELTTNTGLYGQRYGFMLLRLNMLGGSLSNLVAMQGASNSQTTIKNNILANKAVYYSIVPTSIFSAPGNGTDKIHLTSTGFLAVGNTVYIAAEGQEELHRAVKAISGNMITLNDVIPSKYRPSEKARLYKDLT